MNRHHHATNNDVLGAPPGVPIEECKALPITRVRWADGVDGVASFWLPSSEEMRLLNAGKAVRISVIGRTHPPIYIGVDGDGLL